MTITKPKQNLINHIALVLDASYSMFGHTRNVITVADGIIANLAKRSQEMDQETRATVYTFNSNGVKCLFYDKDVLRMPSLKNEYVASGGTPLIDASVQALEDLEKTAQLYGDHAFLLFVLTDGQENESRLYRPVDLTGRLTRLKENWTYAALVPDQMGAHYAKGIGFAPGNVQVWDTTTAEGVAEVGKVVRQSTDAFMTQRAAGVRGSKTLFADTSKLDAQHVASIPALLPGQFRLLKVDRVQEIQPFVEKELNRQYILGEAFYQLTKTEIVQPHKDIALYRKKDHKVFIGKEARTLLGLPSTEVRLKPASHPDYTIFVQSKSVNRKLMPNTQVLLPGRTV